MLVCTIGLAAQKRKEASKRGREREMEVCCPEKYVEQGGCVVSTRSLEGDAVLQGLWAEMTGQKASTVRKFLCDNEYHCSCKQVNNTRTRLKEMERMLESKLEVSKYK